MKKAKICVTVFRNYLYVHHQSQINFIEEIFFKLFTRIVKDSDLKTDHQKKILTREEKKNVHMNIKTIAPEMKGSGFDKQECMDDIFV